MPGCADSVRAHAVVHMGKHGNLEWLPGKAVALSSECFPEAALGAAAPSLSLHRQRSRRGHPGQAPRPGRHRRSSDAAHDARRKLRPPGRARAAGRRILRGRRGRSAARAGAAATQILDLVRADGPRPRLRHRGGRSASRTPSSKLDAYLCELKEMQIRDGLHVFGRSPEGATLADLLVAIARLPRGAAPQQASLLRALAARSRPRLRSARGAPRRTLDGARPACSTSSARGAATGDTVERLEHLGPRWLRGARAAEPSWTRTRAVLDWTGPRLRPALRASGAAEIDGLLRGLDGRFVPPGPSGAPTRGRPDVLPTGRNFYSLDSRAVPTPAAWQLGWKSAALLIERHAQDHGDCPKRIALSAWGTANMRTGGDDIAQALALMGVRPRWELETGRVIGFEIMPACVLDRPRVDVTLRVSGFFRDAFPNLIDLFDSAARAVAALDEDEASTRWPPPSADDRARLEAAGAASDGRRAARRLSRLRLEAGRLWRGAPGAHRRALLGKRRRSRGRLSRLGRLCLWRGRRRAQAERSFRDAARRGRGGACTTRTIASTTFSTATIITSSKAGSPRPCAISTGAAAGRLSQRPFAARDAAHPHASRKRSAASCAPASSIRNGSRA